MSVERSTMQNQPQIATYNQRANIAKFLRNVADQSINQIKSAANQFIKDIGRRNAVVKFNSSVRYGHHFEKSLVPEPTKCPQCNVLICVSKHNCRTCKLVSHERCLPLIRGACRHEQGLGVLIPTTETGVSRRPDHKFEQQTFLKPTFCCHCGTYLVGFINQGLKCTRCQVSIHINCGPFVCRPCLPNSDEERMNRKVTIDDFEIRRLIATGSFGKVYLATHKASNKDYAIKAIKKSDDYIAANPNSALIESKALQLGRNYRFITIIHCCFQSKDRVYFVMEYIAGRDMFYHLNKAKKFTEDRVRFYCAEIVLALEYLHSNLIVYRDLKLDNVVLDQNGHCKLLDFGMSKNLNEKSGMKTKTFCGTPGYISPEIIREQDYGFSVDWWSLGVLMYEMLTGDSPFSAETEEEIYKATLNEVVYIPRYLSDRARSILVGLLEKEPQNRLGCQLIEDGIRKHAFFLFKHNDPVLEEPIWDKIELQLIPPPYIPTRDDLMADSEEETKNLSPCISQEDFVGFSYYSDSFVSHV